MKLLEFPHSHYCEKARWALDYKGIPFQAVPIMPGFHMVTVRMYAPDTSVPVLLTAHGTVQGSSSIIDYLEQHYPAHSLTPADSAERQVCLKIEHSMDERLGENLRRVLYFRMLAYPEFIRYCFTHPMPSWKQWLFRPFYPILRDKIYTTYVISPARVEQARHDFDIALSEIQHRLNGGSYLVGGRFTRADLSVAAMLSWLVMPPEHPFPWIAFPDPETRAFCEGYGNHPVSEWVRRIYREHRRSPN